MSEKDDAEINQSANELSAAFKVDAGALAGVDADFAKALGFGAEGAEAAQEVDTDGQAVELVEPTPGVTQAEPAPIPVSTPPSAPAPSSSPSNESPDEILAEESPPASDALAASDPEPEPEPPEEDPETAADPTASEPVMPPPVEAAETTETAETADAIPSPESNDAPAVPEPAAEPPRSPTDAAEVPSDFEEIRPRPASQGIQDVIRARAEALLSRVRRTPSAFAVTPSAAPPQTTAVQPPAPPPLPSLEAQSNLEASAPAPPAFASPQVGFDGAFEDGDQQSSAVPAGGAQPEYGEHGLASSDAGVDRRVSEIEKEMEALRGESETISLERDQLADQLASAMTRMAEAERSRERLETSLRAARGALVPLPEGERALRAEVLGLRSRLDQTSQENVRLTSEFSALATELAIATARVEDRQHEIDYHTDQTGELEARLEDRDRQLVESAGRHRDALSLATRLQGENTELRSTQAALEETLEARDLEIAAREDHLRVTRNGLSARDAQLVDLNQKLEQGRHQIEALEANLERAALDRGSLSDQVERREARIASLTETLGRIEEVMGPRTHLAAPPPAPLVRAEWTDPEASPFGVGEAYPHEATETLESTPFSPPAPTPAEPIPDDPIVEARVEKSADRSVDDTSAASQTPAPVGVEPQPADTDSTDPAAPISTQAVPVAATPEDTEVSTPLRDGAAQPPLLTPPTLQPEILGRWRDRRLAEILDDGTSGVADFLASRLIQRLEQDPLEPLRLLSLGGGRTEAEVQLVLALLERGLDGVQLEVLDADATTAEARRAQISRAGLDDVIQVNLRDLRDWTPEQPCHALLLADFLAHQEAMEEVLDRLTPLVSGGALLLFAGRLEGGPVQLSESTRMRLQELWQVLPESLMQHRGLATAPFIGDDGGSPKLAVDPVAALNRHFNPLAVATFGHLADLLVGPSRGPMLQEGDEAATQLLESILAIDESRGETENLPARHGVALFGDGDASEQVGSPWPTRN